MATSNASPTATRRQPAPASPVARSSLRLNKRLPLIVLALLVVNQIFNPARIWVGLILGLGILLLACYVWARGLRDGLEARRTVRGTWVVVGDVLTETFEVENFSGLPALWVEVIDHSDLPGYNPAWVASLGGQGKQRHKAEGRCQHRGVFTLGPWELRTGDPLGLFSVVHEIPETRSILIYPRAMHLPDLQLPRGASPGTSRTSRPTAQYTATVAGVRPYVPGDGLRRIHWKQSAHHDSFMVKDFDLEPSGDLWLVLDLDASVQAGEGAESTLEYAITLAASLANQMLGENRRVGLATQGSLLTPQSGQLQLWRILEALAHAEPVPDSPLARLLRELRENVGRGRTVVAITPSVDPAWTGELLYLAGQGYAPAALLLDAASFQVGEAPEVPEAASMAGLRGLLAEQGVPSHLIDHSFVFRPVHRITRKRTELRTLSATGRVIAVEVEEVI